MSDFPAHDRLAGILLKMQEEKSLSTMCMYGFIGDLQREYAELKKLPPRYIAGGYQPTGKVPLNPKLPNETTSISEAGKGIEKVKSGDNYTYAELVELLEKAIKNAPAERLVTYHRRRMFEGETVEQEEIIKYEVTDKSRAEAAIAVLNINKSEQK